MYKEGGGGDWDLLVTIMGRNARFTKIPSMTLTYEAGPPVFKWLMGPIERLAVTFSYFKLLNLQGTSSTTSNAGTDHALRERNCLLTDSKQCCSASGAMSLTTRALDVSALPRLCLGSQ